METTAVLTIREDETMSGADPGFPHSGVGYASFAVGSVASSASGNITQDSSKGCRGKAPMQKENMLKAMEAMRHGITQSEGSIDFAVALEIFHVIMVKDSWYNERVMREMDSIFKDLDIREKQDRTRRSHNGTQRMK
eukprot:4721556-Amphidinium_carterae.2